MTPYFRKTLKALNDYRPRGRADGAPGKRLSVIAYDEVDGQVLQTAIDVHLLLTSVIADTPARNKLARWMGCNARLGCPYCLLRGITNDSGKGTVFLGYHEEVHCGYTRIVEGVEVATMEQPWKRLEPGGPCPSNNKYLAGASEIRLSEKAHLDRDIAVEENRIAKNCAGSHGVSMFIRELPYTT